MVARVALVQPHEPGATTVPARKFFDICRGLPEGAEIAVQLEGERMLVRSGRSRFSLSTLPAADFPNLDDWQSEVEFTLPQATMKRLIEATQFSMAHQDVRYYLMVCCLKPKVKNCAPWQPTATVWRSVQCQLVNLCQAIR